MHSPDGTEQSTITLLLQGLDGLVRQGGTGALEGVVTGVEVDEAELEVQGRREGLQNTAASLDCISPFLVLELVLRAARARATYRDDLPSDTVSGDETYTAPIRLNSLQQPPNMSWVIPMRRVRAAAAIVILFEGCFLASRIRRHRSFYFLYTVGDYH